MFSLLFLALSIVLVQETWGYRLLKLGSFPIGYPGFTNLYPNTKTNTVDLLISTFDPVPFSTDTIQIVAGIDSKLQNVSAIKPTVLTDKVTWPNEVAGVPENVFGRRMVAIPQGFLVPFKTDGSIELMDVSSSTPKGPYKITDGRDGQWFYHRVLWKDMDGDGDMDAVTCRAREPVIGFGKDQELLWLENEKNLNSPWTPHVLAHGPDIFLRSVNLTTPDGTKECIITAQFFTKSLSVYWTNAENGTWTDLTQVKSRVIDNTIGSVFEVVPRDLNADGRLDLLVTDNGEEGAMYAYEIPSDFRTQNFVRHTIATGFKPRKSGTGKGAPGSPMVIFPYLNAKNGTKPHILLSGDDEGTAYHFAPLNGTSNWQYNMTKFVDAGSGTIGQLSSGDVDGDNFVEVFVPSYSTNELFVYKFQ